MVEAEVGAGVDAGMATAEDDVAGVVPVAVAVGAGAVAAGDAFGAVLAGVGESADAVGVGAGVNVGT